MIGGEAVKALDLDTAYLGRKVCVSLCEAFARSR